MSPKNSISWLQMKQFNPFMLNGLFYVTLASSISNQSGSGLRLALAFI